MKTVVVGAWSPYHGQTGNTSNCLALAVRLAFTHSFRSLLMHSTLEKSGMERAFYDESDQMGLAGLKSQILIETGIDAVLKLIRTGQLQERSMMDYATVLVRDRLEMLPGSLKGDAVTRRILTDRICEIVDCTRNQYDLVFLDVASGTSDLAARALEACDLVLVSLNQNAEVLTNYYQRRDWMDVLDRKPHLILIGQYEQESDWSIAHIRKKFAYKGEIYPMPRNSRWMDAHNDHRVLELFHSMSRKNSNHLPPESDCVRETDIMYLTENPAPVESSSVTWDLHSTKGMDRKWLAALDRVLGRILFMASLDDRHSFNPIEKRTLFDKILMIR